MATAFAGQRIAGTQSLSLKYLTRSIVIHPPGFGTGGNPKCPRRSTLKMEYRRRTRRNFAAVAVDCYLAADAADSVGWTAAAADY